MQIYWGIFCGKFTTCVRTNILFSKFCWMSSHLIHYVFFCLFVQKNHFFVANLILTLLTPKIQFKILLRMAPLLSWNIQNKIQCLINLNHISHFTFHIWEWSKNKICFNSTLSWILLNLFRDNFVRILADFRGHTIQFILF